MQTTTEVTIRPIRDGDFGGVAWIDTAIDPETPTTAEMICEEDQLVDRSRFLAEWVGAVDHRTEALVAYARYGHVWWAHHPHKYQMHVAVHPDWQQRGIGRRLMEAVLAVLRRRGAQRLKAAAREDRSHAVCFLLHYGFVEVARAFHSCLDVERADLTQFATAAARMRDDGIVLTSLAEELARNPACLPVVYQAHCVLGFGAPRVDPEPPSPRGYDRFVAEEVRGSRVLLDAYFLAKVDDLYIGESALKRGADAWRLHQQLTGVLPEYRGRGVATALKLRTIEYARQHGYGEIWTWNNSRNAPMLAINSKLGFVRQPAWIDFLCTLQSQDIATSPPKG